MAAYKELRVLVVDPDIEVGLKEFNDAIKNMQLKDKLNIISIERKGNVYDVLVQRTIEYNAEQGETDAV